MKLQLTKAQTLELKQGANYTIFITYEPQYWTQADQATVENAAPWAKVVWLIKGTKLKIVEESEKETAK
jgi:deoxyhypusine synthase